MYYTNELRWMKEAILERQLGITAEWEVSHVPIWHVGSQADRTLRSWVRRRSYAEPLQYILGTQPFGELELKCKPGVLIPRPETETYTTGLANILCELRGDGTERLVTGAREDEVLKEYPSEFETLEDKTNALSDEIASLQNAISLLKGEIQIHNKPLAVADFCTGTGCIALLLHSILRSPTASPLVPNLRIRAFDISQKALTLAEQNLGHNIKLGTLHNSARSTISFEQLDVLALSRHSQSRIRECLSPSNEEALFDVIISNPPYISPSHHRHGPTTKSVRMYEPVLALVPPPDLVYQTVDQADQFYPAIIRIAAAARCKVLVMEVGDTAQAFRVVQMCQRDANPDIYGLSVDPNWLVEVWRDDGSMMHIHHPYKKVTSGVEELEDLQCRAVVIWMDCRWSRARETQDGFGDLSTCIEDQDSFQRGGVP
ncbi:hypothetical protein LTR70_007996 [Exophiala xenobiotica]|uniref:S-adenosyl-L-methionine-dependent methyltransferase n=1 Tax=Lithohypha guttulata TaxID=1690604 RepID=A0ABR0KLF9_9EURO|nr:hypothetical protein LTR24_001099 [Lithohypha guttulata]KAK5312741.1 hypothetical protein LTR70_007996 [Exophiala xenobiotica]